MRKLAALVAIVAVTGCTPFSPSKDTDDAEGAGSASTSNDPTEIAPQPGPSGPAPEEPNPGGTDPVDGPPGGPKLVKSGVVSMGQTMTTINGKTYNQWVAFASFAEVSVDEAAGRGCTITPDGACSIVQCVTGGAPLTPPNAPHAGKITITAGETVDLEPDDQGEYPSRGGQTQFLTPGDDIVVSALGGPAPAFERTFQAPSPITLTAPVWPQLGPLVIDRSQSLTLSWTGGGAGLVNVSVNSLANGNSTTLTCKFPANTGKGTISAAAMGRLVDNGAASFVVSAASAENVEQNGWNITIQAMMPTRTGSITIK